MRALREMGGGLIIAIVSVLLVIGGISLSLAENTPKEQPTPTPLTPILATSIELPTNTPIIEITNVVVNTEVATLTTTFTPLPSATLAAPVVCNRPTGWVSIVFTASDTLYSIAERYKTTTDILNTSNCLHDSIPAVGSLLYVPPVPTVTVVPCKPYLGWIKAYTVQAGDNLYRISLLYRTTVSKLQFANCMGSSVTIYAGQVLWVPNVPTSTPGVTQIPVFNTATSTTAPLPTSTATNTPVPSPTTQTYP
jgi:LysM repeat protein